MINGIYGVEGLLLFAAGLSDIRKRTIPGYYIAAMGAVALCGLFSHQGVGWYGAAGGFLIGLCTIGIAIISEEQIGKGDGMVIAALGILFGVRDTLGIVCFASLFMVAPALAVMMKKKKCEKTRLPFLPALFLGYLTRFVLWAG